MAKRVKDHQTWLVEKLTDPSRASDYLNAADEDSPEMFLEALRDVAQARQMTKVAREAGITRESLYRATSEIGNPTLETFRDVLKALGIKFQFVPIEQAAFSPPTTPPPSDLGMAAANAASSISGTRASSVNRNVAGPILAHVNPAPPKKQAAGVGGSWFNASKGISNGYQQSR